MKRRAFIIAAVAFLVGMGCGVQFLHHYPTRLQQFGGCRIEAFTVMKEHIFKEQNFESALGDYIEACMQANGYITEIKPGTRCKDNTDVLMKTTYEPSVALANYEDCYILAH